MNEHDKSEVVYCISRMLGPIWGLIAALALIFVDEPKEG